LKTQPSGSARRKKKSWPFYGHLEFLIPHVEFRETRGKYACETPTESQGVPQSEAPEEQQGEASSDMSLEPQEQSETHTSQQLQEIEEIPQLRNKRVAVKRNVKRPSSPSSFDSTEQKILEILSEKNDPDEQFLMSLLPALKRLNPKKNAEARIKLQQVLYETEFSDSETKSCSNCSRIFSFSSVSAPN
jgi:hypothetical protein